MVIVIFPDNYQTEQTIYGIKLKNTSSADKKL